MVRYFLYAIAMLAIVISLLSVYSFPIYRKWMYVDEQSGSFRGYTRVLSVVTINEWEVKSKYEKAIMELGIQIGARRYVSCAGTGYNIFGIAVLYGHGMPSHAAMQLDTVFDDWIRINGRDRLMKVASDRDNAVGIIYEEGNKIIAQQVDSAEASTIAVPPSAPSGSPR